MDDCSPLPRHNELWGKMAPSRLHPLGLYRARSQSEPNIPELLNTAADEDEPELSFLEEGGAMNTELLHASSAHLDVENKRLNIPFPLLSRFPPQSIDKNENIRHFLASLPNITIEDDPGLGENVFTSDSGSGFSSPISSPTDDDHLPSRYNKLAKEIRREHKVTSVEQQEGAEEEEREKEPEEGEGDRLGAAMEEREVKLEDVPGEERQEQEEGKESSKVAEEETDVTQGKIPKEEETDVTQGKIPLEEELSANEGDVQGAVSTTQELPSSCASGPSRTVSSVPEDTHKVGVSTLLAERHQPVADIPIFQGIPKPLKSTSLPRKIVLQYQQLDPPHFLSAASEAEDESMLAEHGSTNASEMKSESVYEPSLSPSEQSNRSQQEVQKGGELDTSGPVELPQIHSVPERIKEIEEMNSLKGLSKSPTVPPSDSQVAEKEVVGGKGHDATDSKDVASMTSSHSVSSSLSGGDEELNQLNFLSDNNNSSSKPAHLPGTTRHSSLSPYLPPAPGSDTHVRTASCSYLPSSQHSGSPISSDPSPLPPSAGDGVMLVQPGAGDVKARVMTYEERSRDRDERSVSSDELSVRRASLSFHPSVEAIVPAASISNPEVRDIKSLNFTQRRPSSDIIHEHRSPSPSHVRRESTPPAFLSAWSKLVDGIPTMPVQDLKKRFEDSDAVSVSSSVGSSASAHHQQPSSRQVKHKSRSSNLRRSKSLRDVDSPGKLRYKFKGSKGSGKKLSPVDRTSPCSQD